MRYQRSSLCKAADAQVMYETSIYKQKNPRGVPIWDATGQSHKKVKSEKGRPLAIRVRTRRLGGRPILPSRNTRLQAEK